MDRLMEQLKELTLLEESGCDKRLIEIAMSAYDENEVAHTFDSVEDYIRYSESI